ncbi:lipoprotein, putative [Shouchella clausii]|nr:lipoprotein, putative [Shouchella clausii]
MEEVISVRGIQYKEEMVMAMHVKQVDRFQLKDVRKKAFDRIKALYPDYTIHISTDKKIYKELEDAENKVKAGNLSEKELEKTINVIEKHSKG